MAGEMSVSWRASDHHVELYEVSELCWWLRDGGMEDD
jgi:hypothetical protein